MRILAFPFAGGSAYSYARLLRALPAGASLVTLDPPGHGRRMAETPLQSIDAIAADLQPLVTSLAGADPYVLFGHSMGAYVALAVVDRLVALGARLPERLVLSGAAPPHRRSTERLAALPRDEFLARVQALGGLPPQVLEQPELVELFEPILRADFGATEGYRAAHLRSHGVPVRVLGGRDDALVAGRLADWADCFAVPPEIREGEGGHFFLFDRPADVAAALCEDERIDAAARRA